MNKIVKQIFKFTQKAANLAIFQKTLIIKNSESEKPSEFFG